MAVAPRLFVVVGLGNYTNPSTRHSIGQLLLTSLAYKASHLPSATGSPTLLLNAPKAAWTASITLSRPPSSFALPASPSNPSPTPTPDLPPLKLLFIKPRALMNISGPAVVRSMSGFLPTPIPPYSLVTLQDDLDLSPGVLKLQRGGSPRGHNGVRSLERALGGTREFWRIRVGVGRPEGREGVPQWVMGALGREEVRAVEAEEGWEGVGLGRAWEMLLGCAYADE